MNKTVTVKPCKVNKEYKQFFFLRIKKKSNQHQCSLLLAIIFYNLTLSPPGILTGWLAAQKTGITKEESKMRKLNGY